MDADPFVRPDSIVRRIWGDADVVLLVFAGAAAEFALSRAADWLFVTGALPRDPLGRLFATAAVAREIAPGARDRAERALAGIRAAHAAVERRRGGHIPDRAHRAVLYLLVDYSERAFETLHRCLTPAEREELYDVFRRVGAGLGLRQVQAALAPAPVRALLGLPRRPWAAGVLPLYPVLRLLVPPAHLAAVRRLDEPAGRPGSER